MEYLISEKLEAICFCAPHYQMKTVEDCIQPHGFESVFDLPDAIALGDEKWIEIVWYYDGGSDGFEEYASHDDRVARYFNELDSGMEKN